MSEFPKKNIVVVGYPKSGTHWICRLVGELADCPILGEWGYFDQSQKKYEGLERISKFQCSKSHHIYDEIFSASSESIHKIIYVIRDPRDVVISGMHYFDFLPTTFRTFIKRLPKGTALYHMLKGFLHAFVPLKYRKKQMIKAVLKGNPNLNRWCAMSWKAHYTPYLEKNILFVSYENMLSQPLIECKKITEYLELSRTDEEILDSISKQSFTHRKAESLKKEDTKLLRKGQYGYWKNELTTAEKQLFLKTLKKEFSHFKY
ncbi:sulfotransferase domain-containing protein [Spongiimicrobium salis]|uniref:sulfotransferase domain-containing protein n=1 Tax=Spongiimicrobium salis TaxID=1667022 RepID=UPI00374DEDE0